MSRGMISKLHPPGNNGSREGAGKVTPDDGGKDIVFQTPIDVNQTAVPIAEGDVVTFDLVGGKISNIGRSTPAPTCTLTANPTSVKVGVSATLSWTSSNVDEVTIDSGVGDVTPVASGSVTVAPRSTTTFTLTATNSTSGQSTSASVTVQVG